MRFSCTQGGQLKGNLSSEGGFAAPNVFCQSGRRIGSTPEPQSLHHVHETDQLAVAQAHAHSYPFGCSAADQHLLISHTVLTCCPLVPCHEHRCQLCQRSGWLERVSSDRD